VQSPLGARPLKTELFFDQSRTATLFYCVVKSYILSLFRYNPVVHWCAFSAHKNKLQIMHLNT